MRKTIAVARRVLGEVDETTLRARKLYAAALYKDEATLDDLREAVTTLEDLAQTARRVFGCAHPLTEEIETSLRAAWAVRGVRAVLVARDSEASKSDDWVDDTRLEELDQQLAHMRSRPSADAGSGQAQAARSEVD